MHALIFNVYMNRFVNIKTDYNAINLFVVIRVYTLVLAVELLTSILCCIMNRSFPHLAAAV